MVNKLIDQYECPYDIILLQFIDTHIELYKDISPNTITTIGILFGLLSAYNISHANFRFAAILFLIAYYLDCVDGKVARKYNKVTLFGDYYDHISDMLKYIVISYSLYQSDNQRFIELSYILVIMLLVLMVHFGCQEKIYNKDISHTIGLFKYIIPDKVDHCKLIEYTRFCGNGTLIFILFLSIYFWK